MIEHYTLATVSKKDLVNAFELTEDEAKLIHRYRNQLPAILDAEGEDGFCVDMRELHKQLKVKTPFKDWSSRKLKSFVEGEDQRAILSVGKNGGKPQRDHMLTVDCAKQVAMMEGSEVGKLVRRYFVLCEKLVIRMARRNPIRQNCKDSTKQIYENLSKRVVKSKQPKIMAEMHAIVCNVATGARPSVWKKMIGVENVRDFLKENASTSELTRYDQVAMMAAMLTNDIQQTKKSVREQLERSFGESDIYLTYLHKSGVSDFDD